MAEAPCVRRGKVQNIAKDCSTWENSDGNMSLSLPHKTVIKGKPLADIDD
jgi:hypothetical protein